MPSSIDQRRLRTGAAVLHTTVETPSTIEGLRQQLDALHDGIAALQSLDDLGEVANAKASADMQTLLARYTACRKRLLQLEGKGST
jgi:hypothetical protein